MLKINNTTFNSVISAIEYLYNYFNVIAFVSHKIRSYFTPIKF